MSKANFSALTRRTYTAGHFQLAIDGVTTPTFIKSVEGGYAKIKSDDVQVGTDPIRTKHVTVREIEPITLEVGVSQVDQIWLWIAQSWRREFSRRSGQIIHADFNYRPQVIQQFHDALIEEVSFPALDASSKDALFVKVKIRPERVNIDTVQDDNPLSGSTYKPQQKLWTSSAFRLRLHNGVETDWVNKIDGFAVKQGVKTVAVGRAGTDRFPQIEPTKLEFPDLKVTMPMQHAGTAMEWYKMVVLEGIPETVFETEGVIEFLSPDRKKVLGEINLYGVGIKSFQMPKSEANSDQIKRCTFDLYVSHFELNKDDIRLMLE
jgi:phage tail-like protein